MSPSNSTILWRRLDLPGFESARMRHAEQGDQPGEPVDEALPWTLEGTALFAHEGQPCRLSYRIDCDPGWRTRLCRVSGWVGASSIKLAIRADEAGAWSFNGQPVSEVAGCLDIDLNFSPVTNLLPIRRLDLPVGASAPVRAAWLTFPQFTLEPLEQVYRRTGPHTYVYESGGGSFIRELEVNEAGFVTHYPDFWVQAA